MLVCGMLDVGLVCIVYSFVVHPVLMLIVPVLRSLFIRDSIHGSPFNGHSQSSWFILALFEFLLFPPSAVSYPYPLLDHKVSVEFLHDDHCR
jgi:hypothetical protein